MISVLSPKAATWDKIQAVLFLKDKIQQKKELQGKLKYLQMNSVRIHHPFYIQSDLPLEKNKLRSTYKLPLLPGILTYFHYDNMICVCVNARGEAGESWQRAPSPSVLGECLKHELSCSAPCMVSYTSTSKFTVTLRKEDLGP